MSTAPMILFTNATPDVFRLSDIYNSANHGTDYLLSGKQIPSVHSLVVDDTTSPGSLSLWVVTYVNPVTRNSTIEPIRLSYDITDRVISYGNEMLCVYYETVEGINGYRLTLDSKLLMLGSNEAYYILYRRRDNADTVISNYINEDGDPDGHYVPLQATDPTTGYKVFQSCVTGEVLADGDVIIMQVYTRKVTIPPTPTPIYELVSEYRMVAKEAHQLTALTSLAIGESPIMDLVVRANQMTMDGDLVIYRGQSMGELELYPFIHYANGMEESKLIDNDTCFVYGLDDVVTTAIGSEYEITVKCFLADNYPSPLADGQTSSRSVSRTLTLVVRARNVDEILKLSPIPLLVDGAWELKYAGTRLSRTIEGIPTEITYRNGTALDPDLYDTEQHLEIRYETTDALGVSYQYDQEFWLTLVSGVADQLWWIITDESSGTLYGKNEGGFEVPIVFTNIGTVEFPIATFATVSEFIANFYTRAYPPKLTGEGSAPTPTHYNLRYASTYALVNVAPIAVADYATPIVANDVVMTADGTVIVEFLLQVGETTSYLYSVPAVVTN